MSKSLGQLVHHDAAPGVLLIIAASLAMIIANTPLLASYEAFLNTPVVVQIGAFEIAKPLLLWVNDGMMAVFFFLIGLEIKREVIEGHLSSREQITLPAIAAVAGIAVPALFYVAFNYQDAVAIQGWAIPAATDIAFALGVFSLFGRMLPVTLKLFLLSVAIFDDIGAIIIIALFYSAELSTTSLVIGLAGLAVLFVLNRMNVRSSAAYILVGMVVWAAVLKSGVHATLAGFAVAWFIPLAVKNADNKSERRMLVEMEHKLHPWVAFMIVPVFAFANAGVQVIGSAADSMITPIVVGIATGLFVGKQIGIFGACYLAVKAGVARLPEGVTWLQLYGVTLLCGIGFTMSLFIGTLAFENADPAFLNSVKVGVLLGSLLSAVLGGVIISRSSRKAEQRQALPQPSKDGLNAMS